MKKQNFIAKVLTVFVLVGVLFTLASCGGGSLELTSFYVDTTTVKTQYLLGEEVDFSGIKAYAEYNDTALNRTLTFSDLTFTYDDSITSTVGTKQVKVSFKDANFDGKEQTTTVTVLVIDPDALIENVDVAGYQRPDSLVSFVNNNKNGSLEYGASGFSGEFINGGMDYLVGDDNEFKFLPKMTVIGNDGYVQLLYIFRSNVDLYIFDETAGEYVALTKEADSTNSDIVNFYNADTLIATVNTLYHTYDFTEDAIGKKVKISVLPNEKYYTLNDSIRPVTLEAKIIDAYNVHEAWQLAVIDNDTDRKDWDTIKKQHGILGLEVAGVVLHNNISVTANDVPDSFFYTTETEVIYKNSAKEDGSDIKVIPADTKYLKDGTHVYQRDGAGDFTMNGNFFNINLSDFPLVASPAVFGADKEQDYGIDFSNAVFIRFESNGGASSAPADVAVVNIDNLSITGNAKRDTYVDAGGDLASAGGLIFIKSTWHTDMTINNVVGNSFFITYFADYGGKLVANDIKCYDSYQNAAFVWGNSYIEFNDSFINGCGGPAIIEESLDEGLHPQVVANNTVIEARLIGSEIWFAAVNATTIVPAITALDPVLNANDLGTFIKDGKMNVLGLLLPEGFDGEAVMSKLGTQGTLKFNGEGIERWTTGFWNNIVTSDAYEAEAPFFSVIDENGEAHYLFYADQGTYLIDLAGNVFTPATHAEIYNAFKNADCFTLSQGGISVVFELYH